MKIKNTVTTIEIEADARELRESQTLAQNFSSLLSRVFQSKEPIEYENEDEETEEEENETE